jgi:hypothetical protein
LAFSADLKKDLLFHASFDKGLDAATASGDKRIYTAPSYKEQAAAKPGLDHPDVSVVPGGKSGSALQFRKKNTKAVFYKALENVNHNGRSWTGAISFWLSLDPETDLEPGFCDPIQVTHSAYNDAAIWVDFTKDDKPRHFRLGVFGDLKAWNPQNLPADKFPAFGDRLVVVKKTPFAKGKWTHVAITHQGLGGGKGTATLYLNGEPQGTTPGIVEAFTWDMEKAAIRVGVNYVGLFDELAVYGRALSGKEVKELFTAK